MKILILKFNLKIMVICLTTEAKKKYGGKVTIIIDA